MFVKGKSIRASHVKPEQARLMLTSHLKYLQYRKSSPACEWKQDRHFFNQHSNHVDRSRIQQDLMCEQQGDIYYTSLLLTPAVNEPVRNWRQWTRAVVHDLEDRFRQTLNWYAIVCPRMDNPQVYVVVSGTARDRETGRMVSVKFNRHDFQYLCERGRAQSEYGYYSMLTEILRELDVCDTIGNDISQPSCKRNGCEEVTELD